VLDLPATLNALSRIGFSGMAAVELSRDSHCGAAMAAEALAQIRAAFSHVP
jgi:sugar phosphate isomerase/epimerase